MAAITASGADPTANWANPAICEVPAYNSPHTAARIQQAGDAEGARAGDLKAGRPLPNR